jgi:site-specific DNA-cytosine methylase
VHAIIQIGEHTYPLSRVDHPEHGTIHCLIVHTSAGIALMGILFRMLKPHELAAAQGFHPHHKFTGTQTEQVKQIGNAVPRRTARALALAALSQKSNVSRLIYPPAASVA